MALTTAQLATLKTDIQADSSFNNAPHNSDGGNIIAAAYNLEASPVYVIWRSSVTRDELQALDTFNWTQIDNLSVGKARIWDWMFMRGANIDASKANVRAGVAACLTGNATLTQMQTDVLNACKRNASRAEKLFATGSGTANSPSVTAIAAVIDPSDVIAAMGW